MFKTTRARVVFLAVAVMVILAVYLVACAPAPMPNDSGVPERSSVSQNEQAGTLMGTLGNEGTYEMYKVVDYTEGNVCYVVIDTYISSDPSSNAEAGMRCLPLKER